MAWIESHESLPSHPKTKRMCRLLKISPVVAVGHLHFLWWWAMNHAQDGVLDRYSKEDIADACEWEDDAEAYFNALVESGFIDLTETGSAIHNWFDYAGKLIALRQKDAERKRNARGKQEESKGHPVDIQRTSDGSLAESIRDLDLNLDLNKEKDIYTPIVEDTEIIFNHWNTKKIINHRTLTAVMKGKIHARLEFLTADEIVEAINNYVIIISDSEKYWYNHRFTLLEFVNPKNLDRFLTENDPFEALKRNVISFNKDKPTDSALDNRIRLQREAENKNEYSDTVNL